MSKIRVGLVGLGRIGFSYDLSRSDTLMTHYQAIQSNECFELTWICESSKSARNEFIRHTAKSDKLVREVPEEPVDLVVVATPTQTHLEIIQQVLELQPKAILCEKPAGVDLQQALEIQALADQFQVDVFVNYMRRCEPGVVSLKQHIDKHTFGNFYKCVCTYSGGIKNNASHFIDLLCFWFGSVREVQRLNTMDNPMAENIDFGLTFENSLSAYFIAGNENYFGSKELELVSDRGVLRYLRGGFDIYYHKAKEHERFPGYMAYGLEGERLTTDYMKFMQHVYLNLEHYFLKQKPFPSTMGDAIEVHKIFDELKLGDCG